MTDYQTLYHQSQQQVQKQKQQIKKLEEEIRERCQSYLIHSSRFKSRNGNMSSSRKEQLQNGEQIKSIQDSATKENSSEVRNGHQPASVSVSASIVQNASSFKSESSVDSTPVKSQTQSQIQYQNNVLKEQVPVSPVQRIESVQFSAQKQEQQSANKNIIKSNDDVNWQQIVDSLKARLSQVQNQKSEQIQKVHELQQKLRNIEREQKQWLEGSMKKKPTRSLVQKLDSNQQQGQLNKKISVSSSNSYTNVNVNTNTTANNQLQKQLDRLWQSISNKINLQGITNISDKISRLIQHINNNPSTQNNNNLSQSNVSSYSYSTPYRKNKPQQNVQLRDAYSEAQIENLRKKCKQLQAELTLSRARKDESPSAADAEQRGQNQQIQNEEQTVNESPYLIEEELQKPNSQYVKRSFVRKKVVKRNLSAMILRSPSRNKVESKQSMQEQLKNLKTHLQKSKDGKNDNDIMSLSRKIQKLQKSIQIKQIQEMSDQESVRASNVSDQGNFTQIIQVETQGPGFKNYTAHILGLKKKDTSDKQK